MSKKKLSDCADGKVVRFVTRWGSVWEGIVTQVKLPSGRLYKGVVVWVNNWYSVTFVESEISYVLTNKQNDGNNNKKV